VKAGSKNMDNRFHRTVLLLGDEGTERLRAAHVAVFGLGGVGSYVCESLARAGVGRMTIIDFDKVGVTNINRQNIAFSDTVGQAKVEVMADHVARINPDCQIISLPEFFCEENSDRILAGGFAAVVDAIDSFNPKIRLLVESLRLQLPIFSAMGAAGKIDPSKIRVGDISESTICPMARRIRKRLRAYDIETGIRVVYSIEPPILPFSPDTIEADKKEFSLQRGRERMIQGTISYLPALFGLTLAGMVVQHLTGFNTARETRKEEQNPSADYADDAEG
jgi:tRNA A37 threonylcarbamoyladenosine dehydratase